MMTVLLSLLACGPVTFDVSGGATALDTAPASADSGAADTASPDSGDADTSGPVDQEQDDVAVETIPGSDALPGDRIFGLSEVHRIDLTLADGGRASLSAEPYEYVEAELSFDDEVIGVVGVRLKGRLGSYRDLNGKSGFKVDVNWVDPALRLDGLERLNLNNMVQDSTMVHDLTAYAVYASVGVAVPRLGYGWVTVDGQDYGLYALVEAYDDQFLARVYDDPSGNLYDADYVLNNNGSYTLIDYDASTYHLMDLDEGDDVDHADLRGIVDVLDAHAGRPDLYDAVDEVLDIEQYLRLWATEIWVGQYDGYTYNKNNYRVYFDPSDGRARMHPWDHDWAFYSYTPITSPSGRLAQSCKADTTCHAAFFEALDAVMEAADAEETDLRGLVDEAAMLIDPWMEADPRKEYSASSVRNNQGALRDWLNTRSDTLRATGGL